MMMMMLMMYLTRAAALATLATVFPIETLLGSVVAVLELLYLVSLLVPSSWLVKEIPARTKIRLPLFVAACQLSCALFLHLKAQPWHAWQQLLQETRIDQKQVCHLVSAMFWILIFFFSPIPLDGLENVSTQEQQEQEQQDDTENNSSSCGNDVAVPAAASKNDPSGGNNQNLTTILETSLCHSTNDPEKEDDSKRNSHDIILQEATTSPTAAPPSLWSSCPSPTAKEDVMNVNSAEAFLGNTTGLFSVGEAAGDNDATCLVDTDQLSRNSTTIFQEATTLPAAAPPSFLNSCQSSTAKEDVMNVNSAEASLANTPGLFSVGDNDDDATCLMDTDHPSSFAIATTADFSSAGPTRMCGSPSADVMNQNTIVEEHPALNDVMMDNAEETDNNNKTATTFDSPAVIIPPAQLPHEHYPSPDLTTATAAVSAGSPRQPARPFDSAAVMVSPVQLPHEHPSPDLTTTVAELLSGGSSSSSKQPASPQVSVDALTDDDDMRCTESLVDWSNPMMSESVLDLAAAAVAARGEKRKTGATSFLLLEERVVKKAMICHDQGHQLERQEQEYSKSIPSPSPIIDQVGQSITLVEQKSCDEESEITVTETVRTETKDDKMSHEKEQPLQGANLPVPKEENTPSKKQPLTFGALDLLSEGCLYKRTELVEIGARCNQYRSVSGNSKEGCNAIIVVRHEATVQELDCHFSFVYIATTGEGANALLISYRKHLPIRVFRSSHLGESCFGPPPETRLTSCALHRYDGIYYVQDVRDEQGQEVSTSVLPRGKTYKFFLQRAEPEPGGNILSAAQHYEKCLSLGTLVHREGFVVPVKK